MTLSEPTSIDWTSAPFNHYKGIQRLATRRGGRDAVAHARNHLYVGRARKSPTSVLIKVTAKPGLIDQQNLSNEIASLSTVNRELPELRYFPVVQEHGQLADGRVYLIMTLFDELPMATTIGEGPMPARLVSHLRTVMEIAKALTGLHGLRVYHVDLNPMNILLRWEKGRPVVRIVDFESSYEWERHSNGAFYSPPMTPGYSAPEVARQAPDARADLFSLGAVLYTMLAGFRWTWEGEVGVCVQADPLIDSELKAILLTAVDPDPDKRYPSLAAFHESLSGYLERIWPGRSW